jgi:transcriptional regulator with XRE-family HTH domain
MTIKYHLSAPVIRSLRLLGEDIKNARRRRRIQTALLAERAGISRVTLGKIEKGDPSVSMGGYASVLFSLGLIKQLETIAHSNHDIVGRELEEDRLPKRIRHPKRISDNG